MALYEEYTRMDGISSVAGSHMPVAITFSEPDYRVLEYWMPCDGIYNILSIKRKFPQDLWDKVDTQLYIGQQQKNNMQKARAHFDANPSTADTTLFQAYFAVIQKLYEMDTGLNNAIKYVAVDITGIQESERVSFQKLFDLWSVSLDCKPLSMTSEELMQAGLLSATGFHEGLLFTFENASFDGETLTVGATKYRGPLGAASADFTVRFNNGAWTVHESDMVYMAN